MIDDQGKTCYKSQVTAERKWLHAELSLLHLMAHAKLEEDGNWKARAPQKNIVREFYSQFVNNSLRAQVKEYK